MDKRTLFIGGIIVVAAASLILGYKIISGGSVSKNAQVSETQNAPAQVPGAGPGDAQRLLREAAAAEKVKDFLKAKAAYQKAIDSHPTSPDIPKAQEAMENVNVAILFSRIETPDSFVYEVQKGDTLTRIAKKFSTTVELISKANNLKDDSIRIGKSLKITKSRFSIAVDKSQNILTLKADENILKTYRVSTGKDSSTPIGTFKITTKIVNPPWYPPGGGVIQSGDPKNVLGSRWLGISKPSYGIHGTIEPESIGRSVTEGCVRMRNSDVEELYAIVPEGTEVVIVD